VTSGCGGSSSASTTVAGAKIAPLPSPALTGTVGGLDVTTEDVGSTVKHFARSYTDAVSVYSLRTKGLLNATLQVSRFADPARLRESAFRRGLVDQVAIGSHPEIVRVGTQDVNVSRGVGQRLFVWFTGRYVCVLSVRDAYRGRYALLRAVLSAVKT
jgi:hypothetical protein